MTTTTKLTLAALLTTLFAACSGSHPGSSGGTLRITAAKASNPAMSQLTIDVQPANVQADMVYDAALGRYVGAISVPAGDQTVTLTALGDENGDTVLEVLGTGSAPVTVQAAKVASVFVQVMDTSAPPPVPDHSPIITSLFVGNVAPAVLEPFWVAASAVDVDGDEISYAWTVSCGNDLALSDPSSGWLALTETGPCTVSVTATANGLTDTASFDLDVQSGAASAGTDGALAIDVDFVTRPWISNVWVLGADYRCVVDRTSADATCAADAAAGDYEVWVTASAFPEGSEITLTDSCGGASYSGTPGAVQGFNWSVPAAGVCVLSATVTWNGLADTLPVALLVR